MTVRKRRNFTHGFRLPPPFDPTTGEQEQLHYAGIHPHCAMMQIAAEDTHCDYVICRGYDPRDKRYYDYAVEDLDADPPVEARHGIAVAKPYGCRFAGLYQIGEVYPAVLPLSGGGERDGKIVRYIGQNPGRAEEECQGHPEDLEEEIVHLEDENGVNISWMLLDRGPPLFKFCTKDNHPGFGIVFEAYAPGVWNPATHDYDFTCDADHTYKIIDRDYGPPQPDAGSQGYGRWEASDAHDQIIIVVTMDCESRGACCA